MGGSSETTTQRADPYAPAQPMINQGLRHARKLYNKGGMRVDPYSGNMVAGFDPLRQGAIDTGSGVVQGNLAGADAAQGALMRAMDPNVSDGLRQNVIEGIMPSINSTFAHSGMTGSDLHQQNLAKGLSSGLAQLEDNAQNRAITAANSMPGIGNYANSQVSFLDQLGQGRQQYNQNVINADMLQHQQNQTADMDALRNYLSLSSGVGGAFGVQSSTTSGGGMGGLGILGLGLQAAPLIAGFSDRRLKSDIEQIGKTTDGLPWYKFRYNWDEPGTVREGVMADEVARVKPAAVLEHPSGYAMVNYGMIGGVA